MGDPTYGLFLSCERKAMKRLVLTLAVSLWGAVAGAEDFPQERLRNWHQWRGPEANGTAPNADPPITWDAATNIRWKAVLPGRGSATPIIWGDQVFVVAAVETKRPAEPKPKTKIKPPTPLPTHYYQFL